MDVLRTPEDRVADLPGFSFGAHYVEVDDGEGGGLRVAYLGEGPPEGETVLLLHGEPSWSFLYRTMIPPLIAAGLRVIAPDLVGFGRSTNRPGARTTPTPDTWNGCAKPCSTTSASTMRRWLGKTGVG